LGTDLQAAAALIEEDDEDERESPTDRVRKTVADYVASHAPTLTQKKLASALRKQHGSIPCRDQPVLRIPLHGSMLFTGASAKKKVPYVRCPRCACFHRYDHTRWGAESAYLCATCAALDPQREEFAQVIGANLAACEFCGTSNLVSPATRLQVMITGKDPAHPEWSYLVDRREMLRSVQFCKRCFTIARRHSWTQNKEGLWRTLKAKLNPMMKQKRHTRNPTSVVEVLDD
jgi:hypothetical protein